MMLFMKTMPRESNTEGQKRSSLFVVTTDSARIK